MMDFVSLEQLGLDGLQLESLSTRGILQFLASLGAKRLAVVGALVCLIPTYRSWRRLSHVPGPFLWSLSSLPLLRANLIGRSHEILNDFSNEYGMC